MKRLFFLCCVFGLPILARPNIILTPYQTLVTSGAREISPFKINGHLFIAVPQLARDNEGEKPNLNGGNSDVDTIIFKWQKGRFIPYQHIPGHGNEGAEPFMMNGHHYLIIPSIRMGPKAPYNLHAYSKLYQWDGKKFYPIQQFLGFATKGATFFSIGKRHFLALANGVVLPSQKATIDSYSILYEYNGTRFVPFQTIESQWAYHWSFFTIKGMRFLGLTDHLQASKLFIWNGVKFALFQSFDEKGGRILKHFKINNKHYLAFANINHPSKIFQWDGKHFKLYQTLKGLGGRNFVFFTNKDNSYLFRVNFITGTKSKPQTKLLSTLYQWQNDKFKTIQSLYSYGGVSASVFEQNGKTYLALANSLSETIRFQVDSKIYKVNF